MGRSNKDSRPAINSRIHKYKACPKIASFYLGKMLATLGLVFHRVVCQLMTISTCSADAPKELCFSNGTHNSPAIRSTSVLILVIPGTCKTWCSNHEVFKTVCRQVRNTQQALTKALSRNWRLQSSQSHVC